ncbi:MAG TPA: HAD family hydrolase [Bacteroidales bacterium]|nr:HAD family hydrolase [Bacteroidales bacterium]
MVGIKNKAVFLDRDGVINLERGRYTCKPDDFILNEGIAESVKVLNDSGFLVIVISNQGGIAKSLYAISDVLDIHEKFCDLLKETDAVIDDFFFCPHHDSISNCLCRKPGSLLFEKAIAIYNIDSSKSFMIGDSERDVQAAEKLGIKGILIHANENIFNICKEISEKL